MDGIFEQTVCAIQTGFVVKAGFLNGNTTKAWNDQCIDKILYIRKYMFIFHDASTQYNKRHFVYVNQ